MFFADCRPADDIAMERGLASFPVSGLFRSQIGGGVRDNATYRPNRTHGTYGPGGDPDFWEGLGVGFLAFFVDVLCGADD